MLLAKFRRNLMTLLSVTTLVFSGCFKSDEELEEPVTAEGSASDSVVVDNATMEEVNNTFPEVAEAADSGVTNLDQASADLAAAVEGAYDEAGATPVAGSNETTLGMDNSVEGNEPVPTGRVVRYVRKDGTAAREAASNSAKQVGTYQQGTVVLVTYEGNWARLDSGNYLPASSLSAKGIGRKRHQNSWRSASR